MQSKGGEKKGRGKQGGKSTVEVKKRPVRGGGRTASMGAAQSCKKKVEKSKKGHTGGGPKKKKGKGNFSKGEEKGKSRKKGKEGPDTL